MEVHRLSAEAALSECARIASGRAPAGYAVTAGALTCVAARRDSRLRAAIAAASLVVADGAGVVWASRLQRRPLPARIPGIELAERVCGQAAQRRWSVFLLGGRPGTAERAAGAVAARHPGLVIAGTHHGFFGRTEEEERAVADRVRRARPRILLVALGQPRQELFLHAQLPRCGARLGIGVGGTFEVWAGEVARAPERLRRIGAEWGWRLLRQPWRAWRMRGLAVFAWLVLRRRISEIYSRK